MIETIYENEHVIIAAEIYDTECLVLSFSPMGGNPNFTKENGFARGILSKNKISGLYFIPKWDHWYLPEYLSDGLEISRKFTSKFNRIKMYGVSMGGYPAIKYAALFQADRVISFYPQILISKEKAGFDNRYSNFWDKLLPSTEDWMHDIKRISSSSEIVVVYDQKYGMDRRHAAALEDAKIQFRTFHIPLSGHWSFGILNESGILSSVCLSLLNDNLDTTVKALTKKIKNKRKESATTWYVAGTYLENKKNNQLQTYLKALDVIIYRHDNNMYLDKANARMVVRSIFQYFGKNGKNEYLKEYSNKFTKKELFADIIEKFAATST